MFYKDYIKNKLSIDNDQDLITWAIQYLWWGYPTKNTALKDYKIVDNWLQDIIHTWNVSVSWMNVSSMNIRGKLVPKRNWFIAYINNTLPLSKRRFTLAHELAHILSFNTNRERPTYDVKHSQEEENICDEIARALLLPRSLIDLSNITYKDIWEIKTISQRFHISSSDIKNVLIWKYTVPSR